MAWSEHRQIDCKDAVHSADDAYRIQDAVYAARFPGERARAWKAGTSGPGAEITGAPIGNVLRSPAAISANAFHMFGIEGEVAFRMRRFDKVREMLERIALTSHTQRMAQVIDYWSAHGRAAG